MVAGFDHPKDCTQNVPTLAFLGTADPVVPYARGGSSLLVSDATPPGLAEVLAPGVGPRFAESAAAAGCSPEPARRTIATDVVLLRWTGCAEGAEHELYEIQGGGHTWPGAPEQPDADLIGATTTSIDATAIAWDFFSHHSMTN